MKRLICNEAARCQPTSSQKILFHTFPFMYFAFIFEEHIMINSSNEALKVCEKNSFQEISAKSSVTCNLPVPLRFIYINFFHAKCGIWNRLEYGFCQDKNILLFSACVLWYVVPRELISMSHGVMHFWFLLEFLFISAFVDILAALSISRVFSSGVSGR